MAKQSISTKTMLSMASAKSIKAATCTVRMELDPVTFTSPKFWNLIPIAFRANRQNIVQVKYCFTKQLQQYYLERSFFSVPLPYNI